RSAMPVLISCDGHTVSTLRAVVTAGSPRPPFHWTGCWGLLLRMIHEWTRGEYTISTDPRRLDLDLIHDFLSGSYWAAGRSRERVACSIEHSLPFGLYHPGGQVGFGRVVTDYVVIAYLADVFVLEAHRGKGLGGWLVETALGETRPEYTEPGPSLVGHPTFCVRYKGDRFYPESIPKTVNVRAGLDAGKDIQLGVPVCPGDSIEVRSTLHEVYEKTGRTGSMYFVVIRFTMTNQRGEMLAVVDNRFMHR